MEIEGLSFQEATIKLADKANIELGDSLTLSKSKSVPMISNK